MAGETRHTHQSLTRVYLTHVPFVGQRLCQVAKETPLFAYPFGSQRPILIGEKIRSDIERLVRIR